MALLVLLLLTLSTRFTPVAEPAPPTAFPACAVPEAPEAAYGSTYSSNCYCLFCTKYCAVDGATVKSGTCC